MNAPAKITVSAAEFTRQFGQLRNTPGALPVFVTHHGRETHVLLPAPLYWSLASNSSPSSPTPDATELAGMLSQGVVLLDRAGAVFAANQTAGAMLGCDVEIVAGQAFLSAFPEVANSPVGGSIRRAVESGEAQTADLPSPTRPGRWLQVACHPARHHTVVLLHDITEEVRRHRLADRRVAAAQALGLHDRVGEIVLSLRGLIESVDAVVTGWLGLPADRLDQIALADLVPTQYRPAYRQRLENVLRTYEPETFSSQLLCNDGSLIEIRAALVAMRGTYGVEGALAVLTRE